MPSVCVEDGLSIDVHRMVTGRIRQQGARYSGHWVWTQDGERHASIGYALHRTGEHAASLRLNYCANGESITSTIALTASPCRFGGLRWFALCPRTGLRVAKLFMPPGGRYFYARKAWRIAYRSQNVSGGLARACLRRDRFLFKTLRSDDPCCPLKPKWMRWKTFDAHLDTLDALHAAMDREFLMRFGIHALRWN